MASSFKKLHWTLHIQIKMRQYGLSKSRLLRILAKPQRKEIGITPRTVAVMQPASRQKKRGEIWLMYQDGRKIRKLITAWRYPGTSPVGQLPPIPEDILFELKKHAD